MLRVGTYECEDCGTVVTRRMRVDKPKVCVPCGIARSVKNAVELHERALRGDVEEFREAGRRGGRPSHKHRS